MQNRGDATERVRELLKQGLRQAEIGRRLGLSRRAVHYHKGKIDLERVRTEKRLRSEASPPPAHERPARPATSVVRWSLYNQALIMRGECILDLVWLEREQESQRLSEMNRGKRGRPYRYSDALIHFAMVIKMSFKLDYRSTQGVLRQLFGLLGLKAMDYSTLCERMRKLPEELKVYEPSGEDQEIAIDSTGRSQNLRGSYREDRYATQTPHRRYVKLHVSVNIRTKQVQSMRVTQGKASDIAEAPGLVEEANQRAKVRKAFGDAAYDDAILRGRLAEAGGQAIIRLNGSRWKKPEERERALQKIRDELGRKGLSSARRTWLVGHRERLERTEMNTRAYETYDQWRDQTGYGQRAHVEGFFSREVRYFGDSVRSKTVEKAAVEMTIRVSLMNLFARLTRAGTRSELQEQFEELKYRNRSGWKKPKPDTN